MIAITSNIKKHFQNHCDFIDYYWINYFIAKKIKFIVLPNSKIATKLLLDKFKKDIKFVILSGGNDIKTKKKVVRRRNEIEILIINYCLKNKISILGICRGMQLLNLYFKGKITKIKNHLKKNHKINYVNKENFQHKKKTFLVNSFHNYGIKKKNIGANLKILATTDDGYVEEFKNSALKIYGVMWHPERMKKKYILNKLIKYML